MNYLDKRKLIKSGYNLPILGFGAAPFMLSNNNVNNGASVPKKVALDTNVSLIEPKNKAK